MKPFIHKKGNTMAYFIARSNEATIQLQKRDAKKLSLHYLVVSMTRAEFCLLY